MPGVVVFQQSAAALVPPAVAERLGARADRSAGGPLLCAAGASCRASERPFDAVTRLLPCSRVTPAWCGGRHSTPRATGARCKRPTTLVTPCGSSARAGLQGRRFRMVPTAARAGRPKAGGTVDRGDCRAARFRRASACDFARRPPKPRARHLASWRVPCSSRCEASDRTGGGTAMNRPITDNLVLHLSAVIDHYSAEQHELSRRLDGPRPDALRPARRRRRVHRRRHRSASADGRDADSRRRQARGGPPSRRDPSADLLTVDENSTVQRPRRVGRDWARACQAIRRSC
jgi:hypothetical protein